MNSYRYVVRICELCFKQESPFRYDGKVAIGQGGVAEPCPPSTYSHGYTRNLLTIHLKQKKIIHKIVSHKHHPPPTGILKTYQI